MNTNNEIPGFTGRYRSVDGRIEQIDKICELCGKHEKLHGPTPYFECPEITPFERWQLKTYGNIFSRPDIAPDVEPGERHGEISAREEAYIFKLENDPE